MLSSTPSPRPPATAPTGLSSPPRIAPANAKIRTACIMLGERKFVGALIIPLTAPSTAAKPHPSASSQDVRTPSSRAAPGLTAPARIASPSFVKRKNSQSTSTQASVTPNVPVSCFEM